MSSMSGPLDEIRFLTDAMFDGQINASQLQRLEGLIVNNPACLQAYLEVVNLHGALIRQADHQTDEQTVMTVLQEFSDACERREIRNRRREIMIMAASVLVACGFCGWLFLGEAFRPAPLGNITHLTNNVNLDSGQAELGQLLRQGATVSVAQGVLSIELGNVIVDLQGPAELKLDDIKQVQLLRGTLTARARPGGEGFTVRTPDAEVVDLGTEFLVRYHATTGTDVSVRRGRAKASLLDRAGQPTKMLELTATRAVHLDAFQATLAESPFEPEPFERIDRARGTIRSISGHLRTIGEPPASLVSEVTTTPNFMLVIPERQNVILSENLKMDTLTGPMVLPAGSTVSSYLVHYDPTSLARYAPRGAITFFGKISAVLVDGKTLTATDALFGLAGIVYEKHDFRGLELNADEIRLSDDKETVSLFFGMESPTYLDQMRILVLVPPAIKAAPVP